MSVLVATRTKAVIHVYIKDDRISTYEFDLNEEKEITIGRAIDNDVMVPSPIVSSQHAKIEVSDGECTIYDLNSTNGILVGNEKVYQKVLQDGDHIRIDHLHQTHDDGIFMIFSTASDDEDEKWNEVYFKELKKITVGRESSNDVIISQGLVTRKHAEFYVEKDQL